jgi:serine/threonine-protein kinase
VIGSKLGKYVIEAELGGGSMANVYKGSDPATGRIFALKVLHPFFAENATMVERFRRESLAIRELESPHIIEFYDYFAAGETFVYVMEYLAAKTLEEILEKKKRIPGAAALAIVSQLCRALACAHAKKIIHRDIKPSNIFLLKARGLVLSDFGLAKPMDAAQLTVAGSMMGTPHFMAPEQVMGADTDERTDIYQTGLLLYHIVTGDLPFYDKTAFEQITARSLEQPSYDLQRHGQVPEQIRQIVDRATQIRCEQRYGSVQEMARDIDGAVKALTAR